VTTFTVRAKSQSLGVVR